MRRGREKWSAVPFCSVWYICKYMYFTNILSYISTTKYKIIYFVRFACRRWGEDVRNDLRCQLPEICHSTFTVALISFLSFKIWFYCFLLFKFGISSSKFPVFILPNFLKIWCFIFNDVNGSKSIGEAFLHKYISHSEANKTIERYIDVVTCIFGI